MLSKLSDAKLKLRLVRMSRKRDELSRINRFRPNRGLGLAIKGMTQKIWGLKNELARREKLESDVEAHLGAIRESAPLK